jgi:hypothetical protein
VYKFKSEVMDRHGMNLEESNFKLLESLVERHRVSIIDQEEEVSGFKSHGINSIGLSINSATPVVESMISCVENKDDLIIGKVDFLQPSHFQEFYE